MIHFRLLAALALVSPISAQITWTQFSSSFNLYPGTGPGGCDRDAPNGVGMRNYVLTSLNDAWTASNTVVDDLPTSAFSYKKDLRGLLFLLFGITWTSAYEPNTHDGSETKYSYILSRCGKAHQVRLVPPLLITCRHIH